ncbi:TIM barrel protein [Dethiothermospora halolimnae]|uniref:TIM barrel protein n=1 Tax=Dethiothermospora halolimnae TaxID=3114390 RepID=UPI003CCBF1A7
MKLGFTFDEKILNKIEINKLLSKASEIGVSSIELSPDKNIIDVKKYLDIAKVANDYSVDINYHIPYFADNNLYEIMNFKEHETKVKEKYVSLLSIIEEIEQLISKKSIIVVHGANYNNIESFNKGIYNMLSFIDWILNFLSRKNINISLALETLRKEQSRVIGDTREDIFKIVNDFNSNRLGVCWDITHDTMNYYPHEPPLNDDFLNKIIYTHIHGIDLNNNKSHFSIKNSDIDFNREVEFLKNNNYDGILNLELLVSHCGDGYLEYLFDDIELF